VFVLTLSRPEQPNGVGRGLPRRIHDRGFVIEDVKTGIGPDERAQSQHKDNDRTPALSRP
jgi:hypothetical protein